MGSLDDIARAASDLPVDSSDILAEYSDEEHLQGPQEQHQSRKKALRIQTFKNLFLDH